MAVIEPLTNLTRWVVRDRDFAAESKLQRELGITSLVAGLLVQRGYETAEDANGFLNPSLDDLHDPSLLPDYEIARDIILAARDSGDLIYVHGDYDVDGVTSAAIFHRFLNKVGCKVETHVPHRTKEGYGINLDAVEAAITLGAKVFLTCDCGIAAINQIDRAREANMKVVVTDHHEVGEELPKAHAIVNPHRKDSRYPFSELSGAGIVFKLCQGISRDLGFPVAGFHRAFLDLAALGTIADVMPLYGENRIIARFGLERIADSKKAGIRALMKCANIAQEPGKTVTARNVGFQLGPRLNAVGRMEDASYALQLLIENDEAAALVLANRLERVNVERRTKTAEIQQEAEDQVVANGLDQKCVIVVASSNWHPGIVGIVAGRLVERFRRPSFVLHFDSQHGIYKGSARSIDKFHLAEAIWAHPDLMSGGGHAMAAGCSFRSVDFAQVKTALEAYAELRLTPDDFVPVQSIDMEIGFSEATLTAAEQLKCLEPFGTANPEPVFVARRVSLCEVRPLRDPKHVRLVLRSGNCAPTTGIAFNIGASFSSAGAGSVVDLLFRPEVNEFRGTRELQWQVRDFRVS